MFKSSSRPLSHPLVSGAVILATLGSAPPATANDQNPSPARVVPFVDCIVPGSGKKFQAFFGYVNFTIATVTVPAGANNQLTPAVPAPLPSTFLIGRHPGVFSAAFNETGTWKLDGRDAVATTSSPRCVVQPPPGRPASCAGAATLFAGLQFVPFVRTDAVLAPPAPLPIRLPTALPVTVGDAGRDTAVLAFTTTNGRRVSCTYQGDAATTTERPPRRVLSDQYLFRSCSPGAHAGDPFTVTALRLSILDAEKTDPSGRVEVRVPIGELGACGTVAIVPTQADPKLDPAAAGRPFDPSSLPPGNPNPEQAEESGLADTHFIGPSSFHLGGHGSHSQVIPLPSGVLVRATVNWTGAKGGVDVALRAGSRVLARGSSVAVGSNRGTSTLRFQATSAAAATLVITNGNSGGIDINLVAGTTP
jgi:hypothetical protein